MELHRLLRSAIDRSGPHCPTQPTLVFILSGDQGPWALGCAGNADIHTPNLDALAADGTRLENFFCVSPVCSPARASYDRTNPVPPRRA